MSNTIDIDKLIEPIAVLYNELDTQLMLSILSEMDVTIDNGGSDEWLEEKLTKATKVNRNNAKIISSFNRAIIPAMNKVILEINTTGVTTPSITQIINSFKRYTSAFLSYTNSQALQSSNSEYLRVVNTAFLDVSTGLRTFDQSVTRASKELADKGIDILSYSSGKTINIRSGVAREIRTQTANTARSVQDAYAVDFGLTLFEISSHAGARPKCFPYQGRIYDEGGNNGEIKDIKGKTYKYNSVGSTSIGEPAGMFGINCTHMKYYIEDGKFTKSFSLYKKEGNDIIYAYDQKVNYYNNEIEKEKRRLQGFEETNNKEQEKISQLHARGKWGNL